MRLLLTLALSLFAATGQAAERPNIVFIFSDDHAYQAISAYNDPRQLIQTPNIDRIAKEGVRLDRCLVPNSICGPSRACVLTGTYNHVNKFYNNSGLKFDGTQTTFPKLLQNAGYQTAIVGKWHLGSDPTGFDHWHILPGQGHYYNPDFIVNGQTRREEGYVTELISKHSVEWLKSRDKSKPFLLMSQHKAPHREWEPSLKHLGHDADRAYPEPPTLFDNYSGRGLAVRDSDMSLKNTFTPLDAKLVAPSRLTPAQRAEWDRYYEPRNAKFRDSKLEGEELVRWRYNRYLHDYLGCVKGVDEAVGELLKALDDEGLAENTIVVYAADQGFYLGEHGWFDKRWIFEESLRTPCLVRWPGTAKPGHTTDAITSVIDFAPTLLEAAGLPVPESVQGKSLVPLLKGQTPADWRTSFYYHYYEFPAPHRVRPHYGVVTDRHKLVHFYAPDVDYWELYDRQTDPTEVQNVIDDPANAQVVADLRREVARLRADLNVPPTDPPGAYGRMPKKKAKK